MNSENKRLLFPRLHLVKKEIRERFLSVTRFIYEQHPVYTYKKSEKDTKIRILDAHALTKRPDKLVQLISKVGSYQFELNDMLHNNFAGEVYKDERPIGEKKQFMLTVPITVLIQAYSEEECSDVADEFVQLVLMLCRAYYSEQGLIPRSGNVSETDEFNRDQNVFQTSITFAFDVPWTTTITNEKEIYTEFFAIIKPPNAVITRPPNTTTDGEYRAPGVEIVPISNAEFSFTTHSGKTINIMDD